MSILRKYLLNKVVYWRIIGILSVQFSFNDKLSRTPLSTF